MNFLRVKRLHFVGIGGIGMSGLAELLKSVGLDVTGSDLAQGETTERLASLGIPVHRATAPSTSPAPTSSSTRPPVHEDNPEVAAARSAGIPVIKRAEMLAEVMRFKRGIAIAGTHGKTTTTSMTGAVLMAAGLDPTIIVGGRMRDVGTRAARAGRVARRRGGRVRPLVPRALADARASSRTSTSSTSTRTATSRTCRRRSPASRGASRSSARRSSASTTRTSRRSGRSCRRRVVTFGLTPQADVTVRDLALERTRLALRRDGRPRRSSGRSRSRCRASTT